MRLKQVQFASNVSFGGMLQSATTALVGNRPGETAMDIEFDEARSLVALTKTLNGKIVTKFVPLTNIVAFEIDETPVKVQVKK